MKLLFTGHSIARCVGDDHDEPAAYSWKVGVAHRLQIPYQIFFWPEFRRELTRAELSGEISELCALSFQGVLAIVEGTPLVDDYLQMARSLALSTSEESLLRRIEVVHRLTQDSAPSAATQCIALIARLCSTPSLRHALSLALLSIGDQGAIDAVLAEPYPGDRRTSCMHGAGAAREATCAEQFGPPRSGHDLDETTLS